MSAGPRWISAGEYVEREGDTQIASITLTNDQLITLPTTPIVIVPATETLGYSGFPTSFPVIVGATVVLDAAEGAYGNVSDGGHFYISIGSDGSWSAFEPIYFTTDEALMPVYAPISSEANKVFYQFSATGGFFSTDGLQDNAIAIGAINTGNLTDGDSANTALVEVHYIIKTL